MHVGVSNAEIKTGADRNDIFVKKNIAVYSFCPKIRSLDPFMTFFDIVLNFFRYYPLCSICVPNLKFLASTVSDIWRGPKIPNVAHITLSGPTLT